MVRAILDGRKTQTRRSVKHPAAAHWTDGVHEQFDKPGFVATAGGQAGQAGNWIKCPYGKPGDRLWVKETWKCHCHETEWTGIKYRADGGFMKPELWSHDQGAWCEAREEETKWRPSIFMPRWASRITLEITAVRVERLHAISDADCRAEGITDEDIGIGLSNAAYLGLWERINGRESVELNPWVWVIEFKRVQNG